MLFLFLQYNWKLKFIYKTFRISFISIVLYLGTYWVLTTNVYYVAKEKECEEEKKPSLGIHLSHQFEMWLMWTDACLFESRLTDCLTEIFKKRNIWGLIIPVVSAPSSFCLYISFEENIRKLRIFFKKSPIFFCKYCVLRSSRLQSQQFSELNELN